MKAGRELDALIAEKVMGCSVKRHTVTVVGRGASREEVRGDCGCASRAHELLSAGNDNFGAYGCGLKRYSTDIAGSWEVVNHLMCLGYDDKWFFQLHYDNVELWDASFYKESSSDGGGPEVWGTADTPALAICLAALKAVSQEGQG